MKRVALIVALIGALNFVAFLIVSGHFGGAPDRQKTTADRFFLRSHQHVTEVDESTYRIIALMETVVWISAPMGLIAFAILGALAASPQRRAR